MKKNYKLQHTNYKQIPNYNVQNYKPNGIHAFIHAISFQLTSFSHLPNFSASHPPSLPPGRSILLP
jgi:hypothetical protein